MAVGLYKSCESAAPSKGAGHGFSSGAYRLMSLPHGERGTEITLREMARFVRADVRNPQCRAIAEDIVSGCAGHDFWAEIETIFEAARDTIVYRRDPVDTERISGAVGTWEKKLGDCDDKVIFLATMLGAMGHESRFVVISQTGKEWDHVYLQVRTPRGWQALDPTNPYGEMGQEPRYVRKWVYEIWPNRSYSLAPARPAGLGAFVNAGPMAGSTGSYDEEEELYGYIDSTGWLGVSAQVSADQGSSVDLFGQGYPGEPCFQTGPNMPCATSMSPIAVPAPLPGGVSAEQACPPNIPGSVVIDASLCQIYAVSADGAILGTLNPTTGAITPLTIQTGPGGLSFAGCGTACLIALAVAAYIILS
jgi:hypothetical protein